MSIVVKAMIACVASVTVVFFAREMGREQKQGGGGEGRGGEVRKSAF